MQFHGPDERPRIVFLGMTGSFTRLVLQAVLDANCKVVALFVAPPAGLPSLTPSPAAPLSPTPNASAGTRPAPTRAERVRRVLLPVAESSPLALARDADIPVHTVTRWDEQAVASLRALAPDVICVACFPLRLPQRVLSLPTFGCLNVHPSLLPDNRGPDPLFWTFQRGDRESGVTIHRMDRGLDTGPILLQERLPLLDGLTEAALDRQCAELGGRLLVEAVQGLHSAQLVPMAQDDTRATQYGIPVEGDYWLDPEREARTLYNFVRGVGQREMPLRVQVGEQTYRVRAAMSYERQARQAETAALARDELWLRCGDGGAVHLRVVAEM